MNRRISVRFFVQFALTLFLFIGWFGFCFAQGAGLSINPAQVDESYDPGAHAQHTVNLKNLGNEDQTFFLFTRNISGVEDGGVPIFVSDDLEKTGYELSEWITLDENEVTLAPNASAEIHYLIDIPDDASPGSHFGGIFISVDPPDIENSGAAVGYQVANIMHIRVSGEINESATVRQFSTDKFMYGSQNVDFTVRIENSGNVLIRPIGPLEIKNMLGKQVSTVIFNEDQSAVFPNDTKTYNLSWEGDTVGFGRYEAIVSPVYGVDGAKKTMSSTVTFWVLPMNIIGPALGVLAVILLAVFIFVRLYIKRALAHVQTGNRRLVNRRRSANNSPIMLLSVVMLTVTALFLIVLLALFA